VLVSRLERLYARLGIVYVVPLLLFAAFVSMVDVSSFTLIGVRYLDIDASYTRELLVTGLIGSNIGLGLTLLTIPVLLRDTLSWASGRRNPERAPAAWENATSGPARVVYLGTTLVALGDMPAIINVARTVGFDIEIAFIVAAAAAATFAGGLMILVAVEIWILPIIEQICAALPRDFVPRNRRRPLGRRLVVFIILVSFLSPFYAMGVVGRSSTASGRIVGNITAAGAIALTFGLLFSLAVARTVGSPVRNLLRATREIGSGGLDVQVFPAANDEMGELSRSFNTMVSGLAEREALHSALGTYVDPVVADRLLNEGQVLEGEEVDVTIMFVDIVAYTSRVENMQPQHVVAELNGFFQLLIPIINEHGGHTNKLLGDGFMAVFGAPVPFDDHADRAMSAALEIQRQMRSRYGDEMRAGVGLNSGAVVVGTTGGGSKLDFTVIGDAVNVASRIEALTRETGDDILLSETTRDLLGAGASSLIARGSTPIKGRAAPVQIFAAITRAG
jgi:class 3 adenylate cyclase